MKKILPLFLIAITLWGCSQTQQSSENLSVQIDALLEKDLYPEALAVLDGVESSEEVLLLKEKTHLNYGLFLEYRDSNVTNMRDKMNGALAQYIEVLKINENNEKAISEIEQIIGIYATFPDRSPDPQIVEELTKLGFEV